MKTIWCACVALISAAVSLAGAQTTETLDVYLIDDACGGIDRDGSLTSMCEQMEAVGVRTVNSADLAG